MHEWLSSTVVVPEVEDIVFSRRAWKLAVLFICLFTLLDMSCPHAVLRFTTEAGYHIFNLLTMEYYEQYEYA